MNAMAGVGDAPSAIQYQVLVDRCRMLEDSQAELRRQLDGMLLEKEKAEEAAAEGVLRGEACIPGFFSGGSPYRRILESIGHAVHVCSPSTGEIVYWNRSAESLYGWKEHEVIGKRMDKFLVSEEHSAHLQNILERLSFEQPWSGQFPFKRKSGEVFMAMTTKSQLYEDGELVGVITVSSDATHFNCLDMEHQQHSQGSASRPPQEPRLNLKRIQWHPLPQILGVPKIASSVSNEASKAMSQRVADGMHDECAARSNDRTDMEDDLLKKPVKLAEKLLERLHIGRNRCPILEHDESSQQDSNGDRPRRCPLLNFPGMSETSISSEGTAFAEDKQGNLTEKDFSALVAEGENSFANRSTEQKYIQKYEKEFCQCFNMPKPEDLLARLGSDVSENMGGKITLVRDGEMMDKAQGKHDERHSPSLDGSIDSNGSALSRGDTELSSFCDCEIHWEDLQIGEEIGQGSFAVVHRGIWKGSDVAIKVYYVNEYDERTLQDYKKEIDIIKRLRHPNVLLFMGAVYSKERLAIVTEFLPRGSLFKALHSSKRVIDIRRRMRMALDVVRGMNYLHHRNPPILHRDLKSSNLLVDRNWNVKVGDFGLSKWKNATLLATKSGRGTPQWMAPEVLRNEPSNEKSDVFSFGVVLWELMTQSIPWNNLNSLQVVGVVGFMDRRLDIPEGIDPEVASIIRDCWLSDPNERPLFEDILQRMTAFLRRTLASDRRNLDDS